METKEKGGLPAWVKRDFIYIVVMLLLLLGILLLAFGAGGELQKIRDSYENYIRDYCICGEQFGDDAPIVSYNLSHDIGWHKITNGGNGEWHLTGNKS